MSLLQAIAKGHTALSKPGAYCTPYTDQFMPLSWYAVWSAGTCQYISIAVRANEHAPFCVTPDAACWSIPPLYGLMNVPVVFGIEYVDDVLIHW